MRLRSSIREFLRDESSPTFMEYGMLIALIALVAFAGVSLFGKGVSVVLFDEAAKTIESASP